MKKILYLCVILALSTNTMAQFDTSDKNWRSVVNENFDKPGRTWNSSFLSSDTLWRACPLRSVTHGNELMVYQYSQCHFNDIEKTLELIAEYDTLHRIPVHNYNLPPGLYTYPTNDSLFYFSGEIDRYNKHTNSTDKFKYGYFEIRCKLPLHQGAFPAFWMFSSDSTQYEAYYEEIDIFEFSWRCEDTDHPPYNNPNAHGAGNPFCFATGLAYNDTTAQLSYKHVRSRNYPMVNDSLNHWHTYACEWLPEQVIWYWDGQVVNEFYDSNHIPRHGLVLKANYAIDKYALEKYNFGGRPEWVESDTMTIDYIRVYQLKCDCETDEVIASQADLADFYFAVKKSIAVTSTTETVEIGNNDHVIFRFTDSFEITGPFLVDSGGVLTVITQSCPN